jgi:DNA-binding winged helix-turn-helix (wHTH) protein/tetratricopeptide (TPR) repeat protein
VSARPTAERLTFAGVELQPAKRELRRSGRLLAIEPKALDLLCYLIEHSDRVVSKRELLEQIWPDAVVVESALTRLVSVLRKALRDGGEAPECIRNVPRAGYRFVASVTRSAAAQGDGHAAQTAPDESGFPFVGRSEPLARLDAAWSDVVKSRGRLVLLTGPAGIGKTRLAHEFESRALDDGAGSLLSWCYEGTGAPPYWPWALWIRAYLRAAGSDAARRALGSGAADLAALVPEVGELSSDAPLREAPAGEGNFRFFYSVASFFRRAASARPLLLMIEDVQWADRSTLQLLSFVARELRDAPVLLLATARSEGPSDGRVFADLHAALRQPEGVSIPLQALRSDEVDALVRARLGTHVDPGVLRAIEARTEGNPLFVHELVRSLEASGGAVGVEHVRALIPAAVQGALTERVAQASERCRELLELAAVLGREFSLWSMRRTALRDVEGALEEALARGILCEHRDRPGFFRFGHSLVAEILRAGLSPVRRLRAHRELAAALDQDRDPDAVAAELAEHHLVLARSGAPAEPAVTWATRAAEVALRAFAYSEAARLYQRALEAALLRRPVDPRQQCELLLAAADALKRAGQRDEARATLERASALAREGGWPELLALCALALAPGVFSTGGSDDPGGRLESSSYDGRLVCALEEALALLPEEDSSLRSILLSRHAIALIGGAPEAERARIAALALRVAERTGDAVALGYAIGGVHTTLCRPQDFQQRWELVERMRARAASGSDLELSVMQRVYWISLLLEIGDLGAVDREIEACLRYASELRLPRSLWYAESYRATRICTEGRFRDASEQIEKLVVQAERAGDPSAVFMLRMRLALVRSEIEVGPAVQTLMSAATQLYPSMRFFHAGLTKIYSDNGRFEDARRELDVLAADDFAHIPHNEGWPLTMALLAEASVTLRDRARCARLYELLLPASGRFIVIIFAASLFGSADRLLGKLAHTCGNPERAAEHFERGLAIERAAGARPWLGWTLHDFAQFLGERACGDDVARARAYLEQARAIAADLAMVRLLERIDRTRAEVPALR